MQTCCEFFLERVVDEAMPCDHALRMCPFTSVLFGRQPCHEAVRTYEALELTADDVDGKVRLAGPASDGAHRRVVSVRGRVVRDLEDRRREGCRELFVEGGRSRREVVSRRELGRQGCSACSVRFGC